VRLAAGDALVGQPSGVGLVGLLGAAGFWATAGDLDKSAMSGVTICVHALEREALQRLALTLDARYLTKLRLSWRTQSVGS
jgi:hypothetical protein